MNLMHRIWQLKLKTTNIAKAYSHLDKQERSIKIEFKSESSINRAPNSGEVVLYNINPKDIASIASEYIRGKAANSPSEVELQAGYGDTMGIILYGSIYEAIASFHPGNNSIKLNIMNNTPTEQSKYFVVSLANNTTFKDICAEISNKAKLTLNYDPRIPNREIKDFSFAGNLKQQVDNLRKYYPDDILVYIKEKKLIVKSVETKQPSIPLITKDGGLLGTPLPTAEGCNIKTYLMPSIYASDYIKLESTNIPNLDSLYRVQTITHKGNSQDKDWYSEMTCIKIQG